ncbi:MAG: biotin--[acetyl-CoA-carboxylase] ligase [Thermoplasmata archaeon]|nr:biotin--[acetyl-CoA-carboxylase] ligase [Thermoplasmata archaeon]
MAVRVAWNEIGSTQAEALRWARTGAEPGTRVVARRQSAGRGRLDHQWASPTGGLYLSAVTRVPKAAPGLLPLSVGATIRQAIASEFGIESLLKWPNDLVVERSPAGTAKLAGILVDLVNSPTGEARAVVGVGVNVSIDRSAVPSNLSARMAMLSELTTSDPSVASVEPLVWRAIGAAVDRLDAADGPRTVLEDCRLHLFGVGRSVLVDGQSVGRFRSIADDGAATVELDGELSRVLAGSLEMEATG